ncbi:MAG: cytochrome c [Desulfobacterales bacterium]
MRICWAIAAVLIVTALAGTAYIWSGAYNISANVPHYRVTFRLMEALKNRSVKYHASDIPNVLFAGPLDGAHNAAITYYHDMCRRCHGGPGILRDTYAFGLNPVPPDLTTGEEQKRWTDIQLFWIVVNGIKLTGMPSFGETHTEAEICDIINFLNRLPQMSAAEYLALSGALEKEKPEPRDHHEFRPFPLEPEIGRSIDYFIL